MGIHSFLQEEIFVSSLNNTLETHGITISIGGDFEAYRSLLARARPDHLIGAPFDPNLHELNKNNAFWIIGRDQTGEIMHTQAVRLLDIGRGSVGEYFTKEFREFPPPGVQIDMERSKYRMGPGANRMRGQVCYHGEFWIGGAPGQYRGTGLATVFSQLGFWEIIQRWDVDHVVAFMAEAVAHKGLVERAGWMHTDPFALKWYIEGREQPINGYMAYLHREDVHFLLDIPYGVQEAEAA